MDLPLKSEPKVSTADLYGEYRRSHSASGERQRASSRLRLRLTSRTRARRSILSSQLSHACPANSDSINRNKTTRADSEIDNSISLGKSRLSRTYSETDHCASDEYCPVSTSGLSVEKSDTLAAKSISIERELGDARGLEDEYIPGLDFGDMVMQWTKHQLNRFTSDEHGSAIMSPVSVPSSAPLSREDSYLDLNTLHAEVLPQPINARPAPSSNRFSYSKLNEMLKLRTPHSGSAATNDDHFKFINGVRGNITSEGPSPTTTCDSIPAAHQSKKQRGHHHNGGSPPEVNYEVILNSLPSNFNDLPYSQRKRVVTSLSDSIDYSQFSQFAKNYLNEKYGSSAGSRVMKASFDSNNGNFQRRSRRGSMNTVASRLLALSSTTDMTKLNAPEQKRDVDEPGAMVLDYVLGKVIGFGAWGTIRECKDPQGNIFAVKIVKSILPDREDFPHSSLPSSSPPAHTHYNPKVLQAFRHEIAMWQKLHHPNILGLWQHHEAKDAIFCFMDRIYDGTLFELVSRWGLYNAGTLNTTEPVTFSIENQRLRLKDIVQCLQQILAALQYMHYQTGIVHGDLKLENVLVKQEHLEGDPRDLCSLKMILCDFGMSRVYSARLSRQSSLQRKHPVQDTGDADETVLGHVEIRSKSSFCRTRKPLLGQESFHSKKLNLDAGVSGDHDFAASLERAIRNSASKGFHIGLSNNSLASSYSMDDLVVGANPQLRRMGLLTHDITPVAAHPSHDSIAPLEHTKRAFMTNLHRFPQRSAMDSDLPHSHIGSLPYAAPELLTESPPPLGPLADIWAFGVLLYAMCVGKLPFQHISESQLRTIITAGRFLQPELKKACLLRCVVDEEHQPLGRVISAPPCTLDPLGIINPRYLHDLSVIRSDWDHYNSSNHNEYRALYDIVSGCLESNITRRWDLNQIETYLKSVSAR